MGGWDWTPLGPTLAWRRLLFSEPFIQPPTTQLSRTPSGSLTNNILLAIYSTTRLVRTFCAGAITHIFPGWSAFNTSNSSTMGSTNSQTKFPGLDLSSSRRKRDDSDPPQPTFAESQTNLPAAPIVNPKASTMASPSRRMKTRPVLAPLLLSGTSKTTTWPHFPSPLRSRRDYPATKDFAMSSERGSYSPSRYPPPWKKPEFSGVHFPL